MHKFSTKTFSSKSSSSSSSTYQTSSRTLITRTVVTSDGTTTRTITEEGSKSIPFKSSTARLAPESHSTSTKTPARQFTVKPLSGFQNECLKEHNQLRAKHGCPPLELDNNLCNFAAEWARNIAAKNVMQHRPNNPYGENIYWASGSNVSADDAVRSWYSEIKNYHFGRGGFSSNTGHFTQVVWKSSRKMGVGIEKRGTSTYVVANYDPPGNYSGQYQDNVPPLRS